MTPAAAAPAVPAIVPAHAEPEKEPHWLPDRLRRSEEAARKAILKELGMMKTTRSVRTIENPVRVEMCCNARLKWVMVRAKKTDHECDARCRNAKGGDCECSCGGARHGLG
jgi:hypothetical protein